EQHVVVVRLGVGALVGRELLHPVGVGAEGGLDRRQVVAAAPAAVGYEDGAAAVDGRAHPHGPSGVDGRAGLSNVVHVFTRSGTWPGWVSGPRRGRFHFLSGDSKPRRSSGRRTRPSPRPAAAPGRTPGTPRRTARRRRRSTAGGAGP